MKPQATRVSRRFTALAVVLAGILTPVRSGAEPVAFPVTIQVDASKPKGALHPVWRFFGADEPNYAYMKDGRKLIGELGRLRPALGLLPHAQPADLRRRHAGAEVGLDRRLQRGRAREPGLRLDDRRPHLRHLPRAGREALRPDRLHAEGAVDQARALPAPLERPRRSTTRSSPAGPTRRRTTRSGASWPTSGPGTASRSTAAPRSSRGTSRPGTRPNIGYWRGTPEEFRKLHDYAIDGVRRALPTARVGGADSAGSGGKLTRDFLEHCLRGTNHATGKVGTPIDFVSFHAKGSPSFVDGHVRMGIANQLRTIDDGFRIVASFPELKGKPIVIGESDPDGCAACQGPQLGYRNGTMYSSYTAASFARKHDLADRHGREPRRGADLGLRVRGPALLRRLPRAGDQRHRPAGAERLPDVQPDGRPAPAGAELGRGRARRDPQGGRPRRARRLRAGRPRRRHASPILAWHYHDDDVPGPDAEVTLELDRPPRDGRPGPCSTTTGSTASTATRSRRGSGWARPRARRPTSTPSWSARDSSPCWTRRDGFRPRGEVDAPDVAAPAGGLAAPARPACRPLTWAVAEPNRAGSHAEAGRSRSPPGSL